MPAELQEQVDEYENQDLFVPADAELQEDHNSPSQIAEWQRREQEQWNREVLAHSALTTSGQPLSASDDLTVHELPQRSVATPLRHSVNGGSPERA